MMKLNVGPEVRLRRDRCQGCGATLTAATKVAGGSQTMPRPGDMTVCLDCGEIMIFDESYRLRRAARNEIEEDPDMQQAVLEMQQAVWKRAAERRKVN